MRFGRVAGSGDYVEVQGDTAYLLSGSPFDSPVRTGESRALADVTLDSPFDPGHAFSVLGGWRVHGPSDEPARVTPKLVPRVNGDGAPIVVPPYLTRGVWVEPELGIVVGRELYRASPQEAAAGILGFTVFNDATAPEYLAGTLDFFRAKSIETFATMGPCVSTDLTEDDVVAGIAVRCRVNGVERLRADTSELRYRPTAVLAQVSAHYRLAAGDVIALGCPPPEPPEVSPGDDVELEIDGIGVLRHRIVAEGAPELT